MEALSPAALLALEVPPAELGLVPAEVAAAAVGFQLAGFALATLPVPPAFRGVLCGWGGGKQSKPEELRRAYC